MKTGTEYGTVISSADTVASLKGQKQPVSLYFQTNNQKSHGHFMRNIHKHLIRNQPDKLFSFLIRRRHTKKAHMQCLVHDSLPTAVNAAATLEKSSRRDRTTSTL